MLCYWSAELLMLWRSSIKMYINEKNVLHLMHQQNLSCWCKSLQRLEFQHAVIAGWVGLATFILASFLDYLSLLLRLCGGFPPKKSNLSYNREMWQWKLFSFPYSRSSWISLLAADGWVAVPASPAVLTDSGFQKQTYWKSLGKVVN